MSKQQSVLGGRDSVKVAIAQISSSFLNLKESVARAVRAIEETARNGAELIVFPEVWLAGYPFWSEGWDSHVPDWVAHASAFTMPRSSFRAKRLPCWPRQRATPACTW